LNVLPAADAGIRDRALGCLLGLAVGDALGTTLEFEPRDRHALHTGMTGGGPFRLDPGVWTDDTSMALALAESLVAFPAFSPRDVMDRFVRWFRHGEYSPTGRCFDIGITTRAALDRYCANGDPFAGSSDPASAGNGSLMRLAPVPILCWREAERCRDLAARQSRTTHAAPQSIDACVWFADLLRQAISGADRYVILGAQTFAGDPAIAALAAGGFRGKPRAAIRSSGYVVHTLEAALWAVEQTASFEEALILAVNLADDADTVGAVTGQLAGALYGAGAIPPRWLALLAWRDRLTAAALGLLAASQANR